MFSLPYFSNEYSVDTMKSILSTAYFKQRIYLQQIYDWLVQILSCLIRYTIFSSFFCYRIWIFGIVGEVWGP